MPQRYGFRNIRGDVMYDTRDLGSFIIMLLVAPLFVVVLACSLVLVAPLWLAYEFAKWVNSHA